ncbi:uncharacterized protein SETTUDRAFT_36674 [Exserohilum turcica Et28A]|uniref:Uncharacterized protein n=1 Tax=Exserohilum turcicum (strain 28A) TaxID=671987 RepID=R0IZ37_EXST2|nr:uncharacterized protein SETTUDRAFT_36674 [Exserohilum turcica Et28A]EOA90010.1 hypothetical protein SETTUDRAFT_36674 [Exserohilum turcica Et28A]
MFVSPRCDEMLLGSCGAQGKKWLVRRRLCTAATLKLNSTSLLSKTCPSGWESQNVLLHRRTLVLFNELHSKGDGLEFKAWLSSPSLWTISSSSNTTEDTEYTAIMFLYRLVNQIWEKVVSEWKNIVDQCSDHIRDLACATQLTLVIRKPKPWTKQSMFWA